MKVVCTYAGVLSIGGHHMHVSEFHREEQHLMKDTQTTTPLPPVTKHLWQSPLYTENVFYPPQWVLFSPQGTRQRSEVQVQAVGVMAGILLIWSGGISLCSGEQ